MQNRIYPVILAGGSGTRLWPQSREKSPKQFIPLINGKSLFQETCLRFSNRTLFAFPTIITHEEHRFLVRDQLKEINIDDARILTEPEAKNTTAACLFAAQFLQKTIGTIPILFSPADHSIQNESVLFSALQEALPFIINGSICVFGINPTSPHTGYGYITGDKQLSDTILGAVTFIEKPTKEKAEEIIKMGSLWNSGLYFCTPETLKIEARLFVNDTLEIVNKFFLQENTIKDGFLMIDKNTYQTITPHSIDTSIAEKTSRLILAPTAITWNDLGSWSSLYNHFDKDSNGNVIRGDSLVLDTKNSYIESTTRLVTVSGLDNIGVIETSDAISVFPLTRSEQVKKVVEELSKSNRQEIITHTTVHRPWGHFSILGDDIDFKAKKIVVIPGAELSLQRHKKRAEHWIVVSGIATVTRDSNVFELGKNESTFLPMGSVHRLQNKHKELLILVEIQTGSYFGEDDIERFEDTYGRL